MWTQDVSRALEGLVAGEKNAMRELRRKQVAYNSSHLYFLVCVFFLSFSSLFLSFSSPQYSSMYAIQAATLKRLSDLVRGQLTPLQRLKLVALITIEVHNRDVIDRLIKTNCTSEKDFEWKSQLRFYW
jgi:hypothetical protein